MLSFRKLVVALALILPAAQAMATGSALSVATRCDGCTALQAKSAATSIAYEYYVDPAATAAGYAGYVYTYDFTADTIEQWGAFLSQKQGGYVAQSIGSAPASIANPFHQMTSAIRGNGGSLVFTTSIPSGQILPSGTTIYDVVQTSAYQNGISNWLISNAMANAWSVTAAPLVLVQQSITFDVTLVLPENSKVTMEWTAGSGNKWTMKSAEDQNGNTVPLTPTQVPGHYIFGANGGNGGSNNFENYVQERFGYITTSASCVNGQLACVSGNGVNTCSWTRCF